MKNYLKNKTKNMNYLETKLYFTYLWGTLGFCSFVIFATNVFMDRLQPSIKLSVDILTVCNIISLIFFVLILCITFYANHVYKNLPVVIEHKKTKK